MPYVYLTTSRKLAIASVSVALSLIPLLLLPLNMRELVGSLRSLGYGVTIITSTRVNTLIFSSIILGLLPYSVVDLLNRRYLDSIDRSLGPFFKGLGESIRAGMTFIEALENISRVLRGPLSDEMRKVIVKVEFGMTLNRALEDFAERVNIPNVRRAVTILTTAHDSGGKLIDVLDAAAEMYGMVRSYEEEKRTIISPYAWTVYMAILIYLFISFVLIYAFFVPLQHMSTKGGFLGSALLDVPSYTTILLYSSLMEASLGGLIVGKLRVGRISAGLLHSVVLSTIVLAFFNAMEIIGGSITIIPLP